MVYGRMVGYSTYSTKPYRLLDSVVNDTDSTQLWIYRNRKKVPMGEYFDTTIHKEHDYKIIEISYFVDRRRIVYVMFLAHGRNVWNAIYQKQPLLKGF